MHQISRCLIIECLLIIFVLSQTYGYQVDVQQEKVPGWDIRHYTDENGLPQNSVRSIVPDSLGNIWLATERGLVRFDGNRFVNFDKLGNSFAARSIYGFNLDPRNRNGGFLAMTSNQTWIRMIDGQAVVDSSLKGYPLYNSVNTQQIRDRHLLEALPDLNEAAVTHYRHGIASIYPMTAGGHFVYDEKYLDFYRNNKMTKRILFPGRSFFRFFRLGNNLYHLDETFRLTCFPSVGDNLNAIQSRLTGPLAATYNHNTRKNHKLFWNNCSNQAFVVVGRHLFQLQLSTNGSLHSSLILDFDFDGKDIKTIFLDQKTGRLFLGSQREGLYILSRHSFRTVVNPAKMSDNVYYGQALMPGNTIGTLSGVAFSIDSGNFGALTTFNDIKKAVDWDKYCLIMDRAGTLWTKRRETLFRFDGNGRRILSSWTIPDEIKQLYQGVGGRIWIGTNSLGLYFIDPHIPGSQPRYFAGKQLSNISWIQHQGTEFLWIGTGKGLYKLHLPSRKMSYVKRLSGVYIRSLYIPEGRNEIWVTTYSDGIFLLRDNKLTQFPADKKQYLASAHCIMEDRRGFFWITTNKGLFQILREDLLSYAQKPFELYYHYYSKSDGFNTNEFNGGCQPCGLTSPGGLVSFPSINGLVWFVPNKMQPELPSKPISIDAPDSHDSTFSIKQGKVFVKANIPQIAMQISTPHFGEAYNTRISYRIFKGNELFSDWKELDDSRTIAIPFQGGGNYQLVVRKLGGFGVGNYITSRMDIEVARKWHETWWFRGLILLLILTLFYVVVRQRVRVIKRQNTALEGKIKERTEDLEKTLSVLSNSEKMLEQQVKLHMHMIASISHDIRTPVRHMSYALEYSQGLIADEQPEKAVLFLKQLKQAVDNMYHMVDNLVNFIKPEMRGVANVVSPVVLAELVNEKVRLFEQIIWAGNGRIELNIDPDHIVVSDTKLLGIIVHNLIDNAIKVRSNNVIRIYSQRTDHNLGLTFGDEGPGLPAELIEWINAGDVGENAGLPPGYEGLGLLLLKRISAILHIKLHVTNTPGALIQLIFPLNNAG